MSRHSHGTSRHSRSDANKEIRNALGSEAGSNSAPEKSITKSTLHKASLAAEDRHALLAEAAYHRAQERGFEPGRELEDWLAAEMELNQRLAGEGRPG